MPISISDVVVGGIYVAGANQERQVTKIEDEKVHYLSRSGNLKNEWGYGHNKTTPPSIESFAQACTSVVSKP